MFTNFIKLLISDVENTGDNRIHKERVSNEQVLNVQLVSELIGVHLTNRRLFHVSIIDDCNQEVQHNNKNDVLI